MRALGRLPAWLYGRAYLLLVTATLLWGGNAVAGRLAVGEVSPMVLTTLRWALPVLGLAAALHGPLRRHRAALLARWPALLWMGALGFTGFNALFYLAAHRTSAVNIAILQGAIPVLVLVGALLVYRTPVRPLQAMGVAVTLVGALAVAARGDPAALLSLAFNLGDLWMLLACAFYAAYTLGLRVRPAVPGLVLFTALAAMALATSLPLLVAEMAADAALWPTWTGWLVVLYVAVGPSFVAQVAFIRAVELIGPGRAGLFVNLVPVFGALLAVLLLGEPFAAHHAAALALVLGGIWLAERR